MSARGSSVFYTKYLTNIPFIMLFPLLTLSSPICSSPPFSSSFSPVPCLTYNTNVTCSSDEEWTFTTVDKRKFELSFNLLGTPTTKQVCFILLFFLFFLFISFKKVQYEHILNMSIQHSFEVGASGSFLALRNCIATLYDTLPDNIDCVSSPRSLSFSFSFFFVFHLSLIQIDLVFSNRR